MERESSLSLLLCLIVESILNVNYRQRYLLKVTNHLVCGRMTA